MLLQDYFNINFGQEHEDAGMLGDGWAGPEGTYRWAMGASSTLVCDRPPPDGDYVLMVVATPFPGRSPLSEKRLAITVNGECLRRAAIADQRLIACQIPAALIAARPRLEIQFDHPDAQQPSAISDSPDDRLLAFAFFQLSLLRRLEAPAVVKNPVRFNPLTLPDVASLSTADVMLKFASLGDNCEFGIAQRFAGVEPLGLLRFSAATLTVLMHGLTDRFNLIDAPEHVEIKLRETLTPNREYVTCNIHYDFFTHAHVFENEMPQNRMFIREMKKLGLLGGLLMDDITTGRRIFVYKQNHPADLKAVKALSTLLRSIGPTTLLYVTQELNGQAIGSVQRIDEGLLQGRIDRFSPYDNAASEPSSAWADLCRSAYTHWRAGA